MPPSSASESISGASPYPERLLRQGRPLVKDFDAEEDLFRRFPPEYDTPDGRLPPASFLVPGVSVNRSKFSEQGDVLLFKHPHCLSWGIASIKVKNIPEPEVTQGVSFSFCVTHVPEECNYAHSEIRIKKNGKYKEGMNFTKAQKKFVQFLLAQRFEVVKKPAAPKSGLT